MEMCMYHVKPQNNSSCTPWWLFRCISAWQCNDGGCMLFIFTHDNCICATIIWNDNWCCDMLICDGLTMYVLTWQQSRESSPPSSSPKTSFLNYIIYELLLFHQYIPEFFTFHTHIHTTYLIFSHHHHHLQHVCVW